jgi:hypothetical protein
MASPSPTFGDYSWMKDVSSRELCIDAHQAITKLGLWEWMKVTEPPSDMGFMFWNPRPAELDAMANAFTSGHSGASFAWTLRQMEAIAKNGWEKYVGMMKESGE